MSENSAEIAWVTGGARGIGAAIVRKLRERGAHVFVTDREKSAGVDECDIRDSAALSAYAKHVVDQEGRLDILVNNAGVQLRRAFVDLSAEDYDTVIGTNVKGAFFATQAAAAAMKVGRRGGSIVNICSVNAERTRPDTVLYCASKGAIRSMTRALAIALGPYGIRVNSVAPGTIATDLNRDRLSDPVNAQQNISRIALGRVGSPEDVAPAVAFLTSKEADYITGATIAVHGGWSLFGPMNGEGSFQSPTVGGRK